MYLITGASGFIGERLVNALQSHSASIRLLSRNKIPGYETIVCDLQSESIPDNALTGVNTVFHLAGFAHDIDKSNSKFNNLYQTINLDATLRLANLASISGVKKFVFISSVKAGGNALPGRCMDESDQSEPDGIYGKTKREAEINLLEIGSKSEMNITILRPSLVYGPGVKGNLHLMLSAIERGWFPPLPEIGNRRSMVHVDDLVRAIMLVAKDDRAIGEIFIVTDGDSYSSREIYETMCTVIGKPSPRWSVPKFLLKLASILSFPRRNALAKILGDECYSSKKLRSIGFKAQRSLGEMNETYF